MKLILMILFVVGIIILCVWLRLRSSYNAFLNQLLDPEKNPPDNKEVLEKIIKRAKKDKRRK